MRFLYYGLLIFSLVVRRYIWLSSAALGTAMTYGAISAVHAFLLMARFDFSDFDLAATYPVLAAGCFILTPILSFSTTVHDNEARPIVICWGILLFTALIAPLATALKYWGTTRSQIIRRLPIRLATCVLDASKGCTEQALHTVHDGIHNVFSSNFYQKCQCFDTCGTASLETAPFRKGTGMQAWLIDDSTQTIMSSSRFAVAVYFVLSALFVSLAQGLLSILAFKSTQKEVRNWVYRKLTSSQVRGRACGNLEEENTRPPLPKARFMAKIIAAGLYLMSASIAILSPAAFITSVVVNELYIHQFSTSESEGAVGQWGPWVGAGLVLTTAIIQKYKHAWIRSAIAIGRRLRGRRGSNAQQLQVERSIWNTIIHITIAGFFRPFIRIAVAVQDHWKRMISEAEEFISWWRDPDLHSITICGRVSSPGRSDASELDIPLCPAG